MVTVPRRQTQLGLIGVMAAVLVVAACDTVTPLERLELQLERYPEYSVSLQDMREDGYLHQYGVVIGEPLDFSRYEGLENDRYILRSITDEIMYEIMRLSGQEYVDMSASRAKELSKSEAVQAAQPAPADGERKAS